MVTLVLVERVRDRAEEKRKRVQARRDSERVERETQVRRREARRAAWPWVRARLVVDRVKASADWEERKKVWREKRDRAAEEEQEEARRAKRARVGEGVAESERANISNREHKRKATEFAQVEGAYARDGAGPGQKRREREAGSAEEGAEHKFRKVHVATAGERVMERLAGIAKGDG